METWRTSTVHVRCVYSEGSRGVSRSVKIDCWVNPSGVSEVLQQKCPKLLRSHLRLFRTQLQGKRGKNGRRNDHLTVINDDFQSKPWFRCNALRSLHVFVCFTFSLHVLLQTMARLPFVAGNGHFHLSKWGLASTPSIFFSSFAVIGVHVVNRL